MPPGFQPPGYGGLQEPFPGGMGRTGGMHMGPDDPLFAGRSGMGRPGRPGLNPPGARYDPIGPPGMPVNPSTHLVQPWGEGSMITYVATPDTLTLSNMSSVRVSFVQMNLVPGLLAQYAQQKHDKALSLPCRASTQMIFRGAQARYILTWLSLAQDEVQIGTACLASHRLSADAVKQYS